MPKNTVKHGLGQLIVNVLISTLLFILAVAFAWAIQTYLVPEPTWLYTLWFGIGMIPLFLYLGYRGVFPGNAD